MIKPVSHVATARRHAAAGSSPEVRNLQDLLEVIDDNGIPEFANSTNGQRLVFIHESKDDQVVPMIERNLDLISQATTATKGLDAKYEVGFGKRYLKPKARPAPPPVSVRVNEVDCSAFWELLDRGYISTKDFIALVKSKVGSGECAL